MKNSEEVALVKLSVNSSLKKNKFVENESDNLKKTCVAQKNFKERVAEIVAQILQRRKQQQRYNSLTESETPLAESFRVVIECRLEGNEQYNRRDYLLFFGLHEKEFEDCTKKVIQTAHAMVVNIAAADISISH